MIHDVLAQGNALWPSIAVVLFFLLFAGIAIWTWRGGRDRFKHESRLPLDDSGNDSSESTEDDQ
jgi:cbb3-type cytochrome oxidase subunit 3